MKTAIYCLHTLKDAVHDTRINEHSISEICVVGERVSSIELLKATHVLCAHGITINSCDFDEIVPHEYADICCECEAKLKGVHDD